MEETAMGSLVQMVWNKEDEGEAVSKKNSKGRHRGWGSSERGGQYVIYRVYSWKAPEGKRLNVWAPPKYPYLPRQRPL